MRIKLGQRYRDKVSGFEGIAVGLSQWMTGCNTVGLQQGIDKDGKLPDLTWLDETRLVRAEMDGTIDIAKNGEIGGPQESPPQITNK